MVIQRPLTHCSASAGDATFLVPKPVKKPAKDAIPEHDKWFYVQKRLLAATRVEKLWQHYKVLKVSRWDHCGLCIQPRLVLIKRMGERTFLAKAKADGVTERSK